MTQKQETRQQSVLATAYHDHETGLRLYSFFKVHDRALSEDLVQETFTKTWGYIVRGGRIEIMKAFLYHTLNCLIVDEYRKHKAISLDALLEKGYEPPAGHPAHNFDSSDKKTAVLLIEKLPEKYQKIIHMRYMQDLSLKEMSLITKQSKNTLAVQVHRGLEKLKLLHNSSLS